ncbi:MAG: amidohydrolase family protein [Planctomycetota bacterium]
MKGFRQLEVIDGHVHLRGLSSLVNLEAVRGEAGLAAINLACVPPHGGRNVNQNATALLFKVLHPGRYYAFGGLHYAGAFDFAAQARRLIDAGCDGVKMIEGKPSVRKHIGLRLDDPAYRDFFSLLEENLTPLLLHVGDPPDHWDAEKLPAYARERGWFYGDGTHPSLEDLYAETQRLLERHGALRVILAHFYFMSDDIERASRFLDSHPAVSFDLTPGRLFSHFKAAPAGWRDFFVEFQDRIIFGTDNAGGTRAPNPEKVAGAVEKIRWMRSFLEGETRGEVPGLGLGESVLGKVYAANFRLLAGDTPRAVNRDLAVDECDRAIALACGDPDEEAIKAELTDVRRRLLA